MAASHVDPPSAHDLAAHAHHEAEAAFNRTGERRTVLVVILAFAMMVGEVTVGWITGSGSIRCSTLSIASSSATITSTTPLVKPASA